MALVTPTAQASTPQEGVNVICRNSGVLLSAQGVRVKPDAWMPWYIADYLRDTMRLNRSDHGSYLLLIMACWVEGGSLPDDDDELAAVAKCTPEEWTTVRPRLARYFKIAGGLWRHKRVSEEREKAARMVEASRENGRKGGRPKTQTEPSGNPDPNPAETPARVARPSPLPTEVPIDSAAAVLQAHASDWPGGGLRDWRSALIAVAGPGLADPMKEQGLTLTLGEIDRWRQAGCSWELDVLPVVEAKTAKARASPIRTWSLLTQDVFAAMKRRNDPPNEETTHERQLQPPGTSRATVRAERFRSDLADIKAAMDGAVIDAAGRRRG